MRSAPHSRATSDGEAASWPAARPGFSHSRTWVLGMTLMALLTLGFVVASLSHGATWNNPLTSTLGAFGVGDDAWYVQQWRLPRVVAALTFGVALGLSGAVFQNLTRNPLGSPDIIGLEAGAFTGALLALTFVSTSMTWVTGGSVVTGLAVAALIYLLSRSGGFSGLRLVVIGIAMNAMLVAFNQWLVMRTSLETAMAATSWQAGSLNGIDWNELGVPLLVVAACGAGLAWIHRTMHQAALGDEVALATGVDLSRHRMALVGLGVVATSVVTAAAGPITFVALAAPQIGRRVTASVGVPLLPAALCGALLLCAADLVAQTLREVPLPVGVVTTAIGGGYLVWLLIKEAKR